MSKVRVKMLRKGCNDLRNSDAVQYDLLRRADRICSMADGFGTGRYEADVQPGKTRAHAMVKTTDVRSIVSNRKHNSLLKAMDAGRD